MLEHLATLAAIFRIWTRLEAVLFFCWVAVLAGGGWYLFIKPLGRLPLSKEAGPASNGATITNVQVSNVGGNVTIAGGNMTPTSGAGVHKRPRILINTTRGSLEPNDGVMLHFELSNREESPGRLLRNRLVFGKTSDPPVDTPNFTYRFTYNAADLFDAPVDILFGSGQLPATFDFPLPKGQAAYLRSGSVGHVVFELEYSETDKVKPTVFILHLSYFIRIVGQSVQVGFQKQTERVGADQRTGEQLLHAMVEERQGVENR